MNQGDRAGTARLNASVQEILSKTEYRLVDTPGLLDEVARLRHDAYHREGAITPLPSNRLIDQFDLQPNAATIAVYISGKPAASIRIHVADPFGLPTPALDAFPELHELVFSSRGNARVIDPNRFVTDQTMSRSYPALPYIVLRLPFMAAEHLVANYATATVRREHRSFYEKTLRYRSVFAPRAYPTLSKHLGLMLVDYQLEKASVLQRYPFFAARPEEAENLFGCLHNRLRSASSNPNGVSPVLMPEVQGA